MQKMEELSFRQGKIAGQQTLEDGILFPMVLLPQSPNQHEYEIGSFLNDIQLHRDSLGILLERSGALLFRGFPVGNAFDFNAVVEAFGWEEQPYPAAACRTRAIGRVHAANDASLYRSVPSHNEMASYGEFPRKAFFFCEIAPPEGGQTTIVLSPKITQRMEREYPELVTKLEKDGAVYSRTVSGENDPNYCLRGWQSFFQAKDTEEAQNAAAGSGYKTQWLEDGYLKVLKPYAAIRRFDGGKKAWFSAVMVQDPENPLTFGDGTRFPAEAMERCLEITVEESVDVNWEVGDVLVLDNWFVQHGRKPSEPPRRVLAALCN